MKNYFFLALAILMEVIGTSALKYSEQFAKLAYSVVTVGAYASAF
jgi:small multidrug resistance pump